mmetsp:Transcript_3963/g.10217  ORF Transcript_3963/g.10217 Transcript_3963/m.10217 type:complete len:280 (-) Transcript_3963:498-1337(-)
MASLQAALRRAWASGWFRQVTVSAPGWSASPAGSQARWHSPGADKPPPTATDADVAELNQEFREFFGEAYGDNEGQALPSAGVEDPLLMAHCDEQVDQRSGDVASSLSPLPSPAPSPGTRAEERLTHVDATGRAFMVDVGQKASTPRSATASGAVLLGPAAYALVEANQLKKGDVLSVSQLAGIMGAKATAQLIPLCHNIFISSVDVSLSLDATAHAVRIVSTAKTVGSTGVEMEALTATSVAALTVYDMCKAVSKDIVITDIKLDRKAGGKSGDFVRD